jgi:hypothetical protein
MSLGNTLRWISSKIYDFKFKSMIRDRFFLRMGSLLPDRSSGVYWHLLLPTNFGGLGLWMEGDLLDLSIRLPDPTKSFMVDLLNGTLSSEKERLFRGFTSNTSYRGYQMLEHEVSIVKNEVVPGLLDYIQMMGQSYTFEEACLLKNISDDMSAKQKQSRLRGFSVFSRDEVEDIILRPFLFKQILSGETKVNVFNTENFKKRYAKLWEISYNGSVCITAETVRKALEYPAAMPMLFDLSEKMEVPIAGVMTECTILEEAQLGLPDLKIKNFSVGTLINPVRDPDFSIGEYV